MEVNLQKADISMKPVLANLIELYRHDFSDFTPFEEQEDVSESGKFGYKYLDSYWIEPNRHPFIIRADGRIAGFVFVNLDHEEGDLPDTHGISEFFVMRKYRKRGIGETVAHQLFDMFPGRWQVGQVWGNIPAQTFWRKVINDYTKGNYTESQNQFGPNQRFVNSEAGASSSQHTDIFSMNSLIIRNATKNDVERITEIYIKGWQNTYRGEAPDYYLDSMSMDKEIGKWCDKISNTENKSSVFVTEKDNQVVGFCNFGINRDEDKDETTGEIYNIYLDPQMTGQGIGSELMTKVVDTLKEEGFKDAALWVVANNLKAQKFYEKLGWKPDGKTGIDNSRGFDLLGTRYYLKF